MKAEYCGLCVTKVQFEKYSNAQHKHIQVRAYLTLNGVMEVGPIQLCKREQKKYITPPSAAPSYNDGVVFHKDFRDWLSNVLWPAYTLLLGNCPEEGVQWISSD